MNTERQIKVNEQIEEAKRVIKKCNYKDTAVITATKLTARSKQESFGFRFLVNENYKLGDIIKNKDGSIAKVEGFVYPCEVVA